MTFLLAYTPYIHSLQADTFIPYPLMYKASKWSCKSKLGADFPWQINKTKPLRFYVFPPKAKSNSKAAALCSGGKMHNKWKTNTMLLLEGNNLLVDIISTILTIYFY